MKKIYILFTLFLVIIIGCSQSQKIQQPKEIVLPSFNDLSLYYFSIGELALIDNDIEHAQEYFYQALVYDSCSVKIRENILRTHLLLNQYEQLISFGNKTIQSGIKSVMIYHIIADAYFLSNEYQKVDNLLKESLKFEEKRDETYYRLFKVAEKIGDTTTAFNYLDKSAEITNNENLAYKIAINYYNYNQSNKFIKQLEEVVRINNNNMLANRILANHYYLIGNYDKVIEHYENIRNYEKYLDQRFLKQLLFSYYQKGMYEKICNLEKYLHNDSLGHDSKRILFISFYKQKKYDKVLEYGEMILSITDLQNEFRDETLAIMGNSALSIKKYEQAMDYFKQIENIDVIIAYFKEVFTTSLAVKDSKIIENIYNALKQKKENSKLNEFKLLLMEFYVMQDSLAKAKQILREFDLDNLNFDDNLLISFASLVIKIDNDSATAYNLIERRKDKSVISEFIIGQIYKQNKEYDKAIMYFTEAIEKDRNNPDYYISLADTYDKRNEPEKIISIIEQGLQYLPDNANLLNWLGYTLADNGWQLERSVKLLQKAVSLEQENVYIWDSLAWAYYKLGMFEKALNSMELVIKNDVKDTVLRYHLGNIYWKLNQVEHAKKNWQMAVQINNNQSAKEKALEQLKNIDNNK